MTPPDGYRQAGQGWHRKCRDGSPTVAWWFDSTAAHEVTTADTVEVTACGESRLPAAGNNKGALTLRLHPAHDRAAHKEKKGGGYMNHTPHIFYWTQPTTRGTHNVATHLSVATTPIHRDTPPPTAPYVILTPTYAGHPQRGGYLPSAVKHWLENQQAQRYLVGVIGTGDINWGEEFCAAADEISRVHEVPVLHRVDRWGNEDDYTTINEGLDNHWAELCQRRIATLKAKQAKQ